MILALTLLGAIAILAGAFIIHPGALLMVSGLGLVRAAASLPRSDS